MTAPTARQQTTSHWQTCKRAQDNWRVKSKRTLSVHNSSRSDQI